jgi:nucleoid DNA-binding protein
MAQQLAAREGIPLAKAKRFLNQITVQIVATCQAGGTFTWSGLGTFRAKQIKGRAYGDPRGPSATGRETVAVDRVSLAFKAASKVMETS